MSSAANPSDACTQLMDIPPGILISILRHVPLQERLGVCTLVCRSFNSAAVAATNSITLTSTSSQPNCDQLSEWIQRHGAGLTAIQAEYRRGCGPCLASLPCPQLRDLHLNGFSLQPGCLNACTGLTRLFLAECCVEGSDHATSGADSNPLTQLSVLSSLQHLGLAAVEPNHTAAHSDVFLDLPSSLLAHLVQLTYLQLGPSQVQSDAALQHLSALSALQHLDLNLRSWGLQELTPAALTGLQHLKHLTALRLCCVPWPIDLHSMPAVTVMTALRVLQLWDITSVDPTVLAGFSQLQELELMCERLTAAALTGLQHLQHLTALRLCRMPWAINLHSLPAVPVLTALRVLQLWDITSVDPAVLAGFSQLQELDVMSRGTWDAEGSAALLAAIAQQSQLTRLKLHSDHPWSPPSAAAYSALTASGSLQHLELQNCQFLVGAWQQMFPPGECFRKLHLLSLKANAYRDPPQQLSPADMQAMVSCCPALGTLKLGPQLNVATAAPLQQLTGLTALNVHAPFPDGAPDIARLTGLRELSMNAQLPGEQLTASRLMQLTTLQQLQSIVVFGTTLDPGLATSYVQPLLVELSNKAPAGAPPDVWLQLKQQCEAAQQVRCRLVEGAGADTDRQLGSGQPRRRAQRGCNLQ